MNKAIPLCLLGMLSLISPAAGQDEVSVAGITFPGTITDEQWDVFKANVVDHAQPPITLKMMIRGEAGSEETMLQAARRGRIQLAAPSLAGATSLVPELAVLQLPFLFESAAQMDWIYDDVLPDEFRTAFAERGLVFLHWIDSGWLGFYGPHSFADPRAVAGVKLRTAPTDAARLTAQTLDADTIYVPYPEIVQALQTGLIEGGMTSDYGFITGGMAEEVQVFTLTRHGYDTGMMLANAAWFNALSAENQNLFQSAYGDTRDFRERSRSYTSGELRTLPDRVGTQVVELADDERARWVTATRPVHRAVLDRIGPPAKALYAVIEDAKIRFNSQSLVHGE